MFYVVIIYIIILSTSIISKEFRFLHSLLCLVSWPAIYIVYAPLFKGCTTVLFEGKPVGTPDAGTFWKIADKHYTICTQPAIYCPDGTR